MKLYNKKIILGIAGGIAAYKSVRLTRLLTAEGAHVFPIMTKAARQFIKPLTFEVISGNSVSSHIFGNKGKKRMEHILLSEDSDLVVIAPATANIIGKIASGIADDLLSTLIMATTAPVLIAPSMNSRMYQNPVLQENIRKLSCLGFHFTGPAKGVLACGKEGIGRMSEPEEILETSMSLLSPKDLSDEKILITAGPTREKIDPVRFLSNASSGKMGYAIARAAQMRGGEVTLVSGPTNMPSPYGVTMVNVLTAEEMYQESISRFSKSTIVIMAAAVSDFRPVSTSTSKLKKGKIPARLELERTRDILMEMSKIKSGQIVVGFAMETDNIANNAKKKLEQKKLDLIVANGVEGMGAEENRVILIGGDYNAESLKIMGKEEVAEKIFNRIVSMKGF